MKRLKQLTIIMLAVIMVMTLMPASSDAAKKIKLSKKNIMLSIGSTAKIKLKNASKRTKVKWKTSKVSVVTIKSKKNKGRKAYVMIEGKSAGKAKITATYKASKKNRKLVCKVTVNAGTNTDKQSVTGIISSTVEQNIAQSPTPSDINNNVSPAPATDIPTPVAGTPTPYPEHYTEHTLRALEQGNDLDDPYTHQNEMFVTDMVHDNPALEPYTSNYKDAEFLRQRNFDGKVFTLFDCAQYGLLWDEFDEYKGATGQNKVYPVGSTERKWVEAKRQELHEKYNEAKKAGIKIYFMMDMIVLPSHLKTLYGNEILTNGKIDIAKEDTQTVMDYMFKEMFTEYPEIDGIYIRYGETYTGNTYSNAKLGYGAPYHTGNNPIQGDSTAYHLMLINYLCNKLYGDGMVDDKARDVVYRTWGFGGFQNNPSEYLSVSNKIEPNEHLYFCIKHSTGDFHRNVAFNQTIGIGEHQQIIEVQAAREYEGKGAYPNYIVDGVINGFEEYEWLMTDKSQNMSLRDVINNSETLQIKGIWTWSRGGGWNGPYINGLNGVRGDMTSDNREIVIEDGSELWNDVNAYVVSQWTKDTSKTDKYYAKQYAKTYLGMDDEDAENFYRLCILSARAVLLGRATDNADLEKRISNWWTRDQNIAPGTLTSNIKNAVNAGLGDIMLEEKAESTKLWREMIEIAESFKTDAYLTDSPNLKVKEYIITTCKYGYYFFALAEQMHIAGVKKMQGEQSGNYDVEAITDAVNAYDRLWNEWEELYQTAQGCPSPFAKENKSLWLIGYGGNTGLDGFMDNYIEHLNLPKTMTVKVGSTVILPLDYSYGFDKELLTVKSSDPSVITVDGFGKVTGHSEGNCTVTVESKSGLAASVKVTVTPTVDEKIELDLSKTEYDNNTNLIIENNSITLNSNNSSRIFIPLPRAVYTGEKIVVYISGTTGNSFEGFRCWASNTEDAGQKDRRMSDMLTVKKDECSNGESFIKLLETEIRDADGVGKDKAQAICIKGPSGVNGAKDLTITSVYVTYKSETAKPDYFNGFSSENDAWTMSNGKWDAVNKTYIYKSNGSGTGTYALPDSYTGNMTVSWRMKVNQTDGRAFVMLKDKSNKDIAQVEFRGGEGGNHNIIADAGDGTSPGSSGNIVNVTNTAYEANTWYDVKVVINKDGKYSVQIGDNDPVQFVGFKKADATGEIKNIALGTRNAEVELTIDDFTINVDKEVGFYANY